MKIIFYFNLKIFGCVLKILFLKNYYIKKIFNLFKIIKLISLRETIIQIVSNELSEMNLKKYGK